jgi:hypothetical protein
MAASVTGNACGRVFQSEVYMPVTRLLCVIIPSLVTLACSREETAVEPPAPCPAIIGIAVTPASAILAVGDSVQFTARVIVYRGIPCAAAELDGPFAWSTSDSTVAHVNISSGLVIARSLGATAVTVRWTEDRNFAAAVQLRVAR